jgi:hypothetical protein
MIRISTTSQTDSSVDSLETFSPQIHDWQNGALFSDRRRQVATICRKKLNAMPGVSVLTADIISIPSEDRCLDTHLPAGVAVSGPRAMMSTICMANRGSSGRLIDVCVWFGAL